MDTSLEIDSDMIDEDDDDEGLDFQSRTTSIQNEGGTSQYSVISPSRSSSDLMKFRSDSSRKLTESRYIRKVKNKGGVAKDVYSDTQDGENSYSSNSILEQSVHAERLLK